MTKNAAREAGQELDDDEDKDIIELSLRTNLYLIFAHIALCLLSMMIGSAQYEWGNIFMEKGEVHISERNELLQKDLFEKLTTSCEVVAIRHEAVTQSRTWLALDGVHRSYDVCLDLFWYNFTPGLAHDVEASGPERVLRNKNSACEKTYRPDRYAPSSHVVGDQVDCWRPRTPLDDAFDHEYGFLSYVECGRPACRLGDVFSCDTIECVQLSDPDEQLSKATLVGYIPVGQALCAITAAYALVLPPTFMGGLINPLIIQEGRFLATHLKIWGTNAVLLLLLILYATRVHDMGMLSLTTPVLENLKPTLRLVKQLRSFCYEMSSEVAFIAIILLCLWEARRVWNRAVEGNGVSGPAPTENGRSYNEVVSCYIFFTFFAWYALMKLNFLFDWDLTING
jgi:hypothetical protein